MVNKGLIKNHSFQSWVASVDSKSTWPGCTVKDYLLFFHLLCFIKLTIMAFHVKNISFWYFHLQYFLISLVETYFIISFFGCVRIMWLSTVIFTKRSNFVDGSLETSTSYKT